MITFSIDRLEESSAVLISDSEKRKVSRNLLPEGVREGDLLLWDGVQYYPDVSGTKARRNAAQKLIDELFR